MFDQQINFSKYYNYLLSPQNLWKSSKSQRFYSNIHVILKIQRLNLRELYNQLKPVINLIRKSEVISFTNYRLSLNSNIKKFV